MTNKSPFIPEKIYNRRKDIHALYRGNWQSGICPSSNYPFIFIFSGKSGKLHGYEDRWVNPDIFSYTGEGQKGNMIFTRGNLALKNHINDGKRVFLFESVTPGFVKFTSELELYDLDYFETKDTLGLPREGIKFFFKKIGANIPVQPNLFNQLPFKLNEPTPNYEIKIPNETERSGLVISRVGQGAYRKSLIYRWEYKCAVTSFDDLRILIASHIVPWSESTDYERLDVDNGLLLSPTYDALFDRHLISFENNGKIILSDSIEMDGYKKIGVNGNEKIKNLCEGNLKYLERHRNLLV